MKVNIEEAEIERRSESNASNRPESRGLHPVGALARTHRKKSLPIGGRREINNKYKRSEPIANNRPESRGLHPVGALARTRRKKSLPIEGRPEKETSMKIRTDCKQSARISGTTPSECACAHPPEEKSPDWRKARKRNKYERSEPIANNRPESRG